MSKTLFVSYVHEDRAHRNTIEQWVRQGMLGPVVINAESEDYRQMGEAAIKGHLQPKIRGCATVLCVVGNDTHNHAWVQYELSVASSLGKNIVFARIPGTRGALPPHHRHIQEVALDPSSLKRFI